jgi:hypothetical protein
MIGKINSDQWLMVSQEVVTYRATVPGDDFSPVPAHDRGPVDPKRHVSGRISLSRRNPSSADRTASQICTALRRDAGAARRDARGLDRAR